MSSNRNNYIGKNTVTTYLEVSYPKGTYVERQLKLWKSKQITSNSFIESEWDRIVGSTISGDTGTTIGIWRQIENISPSISNIQIPLEYRLDNNANSEIVFLRGQFGLKSSYSDSTLFVGRLPSDARPENDIKVVNKSTSETQNVTLEIRTNGEIFLLYDRNLSTTPIGQITNRPYSLNNIFFRPNTLTNSFFILGAEGNTPNEACNNKDNENNNEPTLGDIGDHLNIPVTGEDGWFYIKNASPNLTNRINSAVQVNSSQEIIGYDVSPCPSITTTTTTTITTSTTTTIQPNPLIFVALTTTSTPFTNTNELISDITTIRLHFTTDIVNTQTGIDINNPLINNEPLMISILPSFESSTTFNFSGSANLTNTPPLDNNYYNGLTLNTEIIGGFSFAYIEFNVLNSSEVTGFNINITNPNNNLGTTFDTIDSDFVLKNNPSAQTSYGYTLINSNAVTITQASINLQ